MKFNSLKFALSRLADGDSVAVEAGACESLFPPGVMSVEGRSKMYGFADLMRCSVQWDSDHLIRFVKRPSFR
jgi:hypothetical protein